MSSNLTPNLGLHTWEPGDSFLREEFNENFQRLDGRYVTGVYQGDDGAERSIELGFTPTLVFVLNDSSGLGSYQAIYGGMATAACPLTSLLDNNPPALTVTEGGFKVYTYVRMGSTIIRTNEKGEFHYLALR